MSATYTTRILVTLSQILELLACRSVFLVRILKKSNKKCSAHYNSTAEFNAKKQMTGEFLKKTSE